MSEAMAVQEYLYDAKGQITKTIDFGIDLRVSTQTPVPPQGLRFNFDWQADLAGSKLKGRIVGTNYAYTTADGVSHVDSQGVLTTPEGDRIAVHTTGISTRKKDSPLFLQHENISFFTGSERYRWVNQVQAWGNGTVDLATGRFEIKAYIA